MRAGYLPTLASRQAVQAEFRFIRVGPGERPSEATGGIAKLPGFSVHGTVPAGLRKGGNAGDIDIGLEIEKQVNKI